MEPPPNVHRALAELKTIDKRISDAVAESVLVTANKHQNKKIDGVSLNDYRDKMKSSYQRVKDLIKRRNAIKTAVVNSNAVTTVVVCGTTYTVAAAIDLKNHGMAGKKLLLRAMKHQLNVAQEKISRYSGENIERMAEQYILNIIQSQPKDAKASSDSEAMKKMRQEYIENNTFDLLDPIGVSEKIQELENEINEFEAEIDAVLSTSNAMTMISFDC